MSYKTVKKTTDFCKKDLFKLVRCSHFLFCCLDKTRIGSEYIARNKALIQKTLFIPTLNTMTKFVIMTI